MLLTAMFIFGFASTTTPDFGECCASVVGVAADDVLNIRNQPSVNGTIIGNLEPNQSNIWIGRCISDGKLVDAYEWIETSNSNERIPNTWCNIEAADQDGWVNARFLVPSVSSLDSGSGFIPTQNASPPSNVTDQASPQAHPTIAENRSQPSTERWLPVAIVVTFLISLLGFVTSQIIKSFSRSQWKSSQMYLKHRQSDHPQFMSGWWIESRSYLLNGATHFK